VFFHKIQLLLALFTSRLIKRKLNKISLKQNKVRLLIDYTGINENAAPNGIERVLRNITKYLKSDDFEIMKVEFFEIFTVAYIPGGYQNINTERLSTKKRVILKLKYYLQAYKYSIKTGDNDVILYLNHFPYGKHKAVQYFKEKSGGKVIYMIHDLLPIRYPQFFGESEKEIFGKWLQDSVNYASGYIAVSRTTRNDLLNYMDEKGICKDSFYVGVIQLGADIDISGDKITYISQQIQKIFDNRSVYLIVSTVEPRKNHQYLLNSFEKIWEKDIDVTLLIIGKIGWLTDKILIEIKNHPLYEKKLFMCNHVNDNELVYCYQHAKCFLFPSYAEGFGLPIVESISYGLPVLASDTAIHREIGRDSIEYFDIYNPEALVELIIDIETRGKPLKIPQNDIIISWQESSHMFMNEIQKILKRYNNS